MKLRDISRKIRAPINRHSAFNKLRYFHSKPRSTDELIDMAMDFKTRGLYRVESVQKRSEILSLASAVKSINPERIMEIGTCNGGTLFIWANIASKHVITCDLNKSKIRDELYSKFPPDDSSCVVTPMAGDSHSKEFLAKIEKILSGEKVDFLFIDGDHTKEGVKKDYEMYSPFVRTGGIIAFHDILEKQPTPNNQVYHFWKTIKQTSQSEEFVDDYSQTGYGIGILRVGCSIKN